MKKFIIFLLLAIFGLSLNAQITFQKTFGGINAYEANYVQQTNDEGYIMTGWTQSGILGSAWDVFLIKTDINGNELWNKTYGDSDTAYESGTCVEQTTDGGYVISGEHSNSGFNRGFLIKTKPNGDTLWVKMYENSDSRFVTVRQTLDGGYIAGGNSKIFKVDSLGNVIWAKKYNGMSSVNELQQTSDGGFVVTGSNAGDTSPFLLKINSLGDIIWCKSYPAGYAKSVQQTADGGYIIAGINGSSPPYLGYFIKTDENGDMVWGKNYGSGSGIGYGFFSSSVRQVNGGGYIALLVNSFDVGVFYFNTIRIDSVGNFIWGKNYQSTYCYGFCIKQTTDEGFVFAGWKGDTLSSHKHEVYLVKTDQNGVSCNESSYLLFTSNITGVATSLIYTAISVNNILNSFPVYVSSFSLTENILCETIIIDNFFPKNEISIYPNPVENFLNLEFQSDKKEKIKIEMINLLGQVVLSKNFQTQQSKNNFTLEVSKISKGIYMLRMMGSEIFIKKIVKE